MLLIVIVWLGSRAFLLGALSADQYLTAGLLLKSLLVETFRANKHAYVVDTRVLG